MAFGDDPGFPGLLTARHGVSRSVDGRGANPGDPVGHSVGPYDSFNLGYRVGDAPEAVCGNRLLLADLIGVAPGHLVWMDQVHGTNVVEVAGPVPGDIPAADAMVSRARGIALGVLVADCVPVLANDPVAGVIGVAHAGRLGAAAGILPALLAAMQDLGAHPGSLRTVVGPAICGSCYEVPAEMRDEVDSRLPGSACLTRAATPGLDLRAGLLRQLDLAAVGSVVVDWRCTREDPDLFSHRRSAPTGRFAGVVQQ